MNKTELEKESNYLWDKYLKGKSYNKKNIMAAIKEALGNNTYPELPNWLKKAKK